MSETPEAFSELYRDVRNTGPQTRARYEYQDACVALRCIENLPSISPLLGVVVEWATDYVVLAPDEHHELVSVKHREAGQGDWTYAELKHEKVLHDLHGVWKAMGESGDYVFESNHGFARTALPYVIDASHTQTSQRDVDILARDLGINSAEAQRFLNNLRLRREPLPSRRYIDDVAIRKLQQVMLELDLDPGRAQGAYAAILARLAAASTERQPSPEARLERMVGFMRDVATRSGPRFEERFVSFESLRELVRKACRNTAYRTVRLTADPLFVGRQTIFTRLDELLRLGASEAVAPVVLSGTAGIGKSAIARQYVAERSGIITAHLLPADSRATLAHALYSLTSSTPRVVAKSALNSHVSQPQGDLSVPEDPNLVFIIDGVTDPATVRGLIPRRSQTRFIVTATPVHVDDGFIHIPIEPLGREESIQYLRSVLAEDKENDRLADALAGHPLGLVQAATYCRIQRITAAAYLQRIDGALAPMLDAGQAFDHPSTVTASIRELLRMAGEQEPAAVTLASVVCHTAPEPILESVFDNPALVLSTGEESIEFAERILRLTDVLTRDQAMAALHQFSLVIREDDMLRVHPLVQSIIRESIPVEDRAQWSGATLALLLNAESAARTAKGSSIDPVNYGPHIAATVEYVSAEDPNHYLLFAAFGWLGSWQLGFGDLAVAASYMRRGLEVARSHALPGNVIAVILDRLASAQRAAGLITEALASIDEWIATAGEGDDTEQILKAMMARAQTLSYAARYTDARDAYEAIEWADLERHLGIRDQIFRLSLLGDIQVGTGNPARALESVKTALSLVPAVEDEDQRRDHLAALNKQAGIALRELGRPEEALRHMQVAYENIDASSLTYASDILLALANTLLDLDRRDEALVLVEKGLEVTASRGANSPIRASFLQARGRIWFERDSLQEARSDIEASLETLRAGGDPYRTNLASAYFNLGMINIAEDRNREAIEFLTHARDIEIEIYGSGTANVIGEEVGLSAAHYQLQEYADAGVAIERALGLMRKGHPQGRRFRDRALELAILIDLEVGPR